MGIDFAADVNVALAYNKLCDDIADERGQKRIRAKVGRAALKQDYAKARRYNKALCGAIERSMAELNAIEKSMDGSIDAPAAAFAGLMHSAALCAPIESMPIRKAFAALCAAPLLSVKAAWELADILNACMALPNLTALLLLWRQVVEGSRRPAGKT